jgi:hypothetical protein
MRACPRRAMMNVSACRTNPGRSPRTRRSRAAFGQLPQIWDRASLRTLCATGWFYASCRPGGHGGTSRVGLRPGGGARQGPAMMLHLTGKPTQVITQGHHGDPDRPPVSPTRRSRSFQSRRHVPRPYQPFRCTAHAAALKWPDWPGGPAVAGEADAAVCGPLRYAP